MDDRRKTRAPAGSPGRGDGMEPAEDPRVRVARHGLFFSWTYYTLFLAAALAAAAAGGDEPRWFGLPRWVAAACVVVPAGFVAALVPLVEKLLPDFSLSDEPENRV